MHPFQLGWHYIVDNFIDFFFLRLIECHFIYFYFQNKIVTVFIVCHHDFKELFGLSYWGLNFEMVISKLSFVLDIYFIWKFKFLPSTLIYFKMTISKYIRSLFSNRSFQNGHFKIAIQTNLNINRGWDNYN